MKSLVIDFGTGETKVGIGGENGPSRLISTLIDPNPGINGPFYLGESEREFQTTLRKFKRGYDFSWDDKEKFLGHIFQEIGYDYRLKGTKPQDHPILMTRHPLQTCQESEKQTQLIFETFNCPAFYPIDDAVCSLYASGRSTGLVVDFGHSETRVVPIHDGNSLLRSIRVTEISGQAVTLYLSCLLLQKGYPLKTPSEAESFAINAKERFCSVALDYKSEMEQEMARQFERFEGGADWFGNEVVTAPEAFFQPSLLPYPCRAVQHLVYDAVADSPLDLMTELGSNVILVGGGSMFKNMQDRLYKESLLFPNPTVRSLGLVCDTFQRDQLSLFSKLPGIHFQPHPLSPPGRPREVRIWLLDHRWACFRSSH